MLTINRVTYRIAGRTILDNISASIQEGWKVGVVGANGAGKSTLFKIIAKELQVDSGSVDLNDRYSLGWVRQDIPDSDKSLVDIVLEADTERTRLMEASTTETDPYKLGDIYDRLNDIDAYMAPARAAKLLAGLGFSEEQQQQPITDFSGGWRMRVALAAALFRQPDFLLLDEPTNHLDLEAIMWLESYLASYPRTVMIISHDRELLNVCTDHILHVDKQGLTIYKGNYDSFERERSARLINQQKMHEKQAAQIAHMQKFIDKFKAKASKAKQAQSRMKALEKIDVVDAVMADRAVKFMFPQAEELAPPLISINNVDVGYTAGEPVLSGLQQRIDTDDRIALLGANGNGKSTLMKLIAGRLKPMAGEVDVSSKLRIGYFSQHQTDELDMDATPVQELQRKMRGQSESEVRGKLGRFGFSKPLSDNKIGSLSGGEKARLLFCIMSCDNPHILLLDEPTNHLDMDSREALVQALNNFEGAVIIVSHDPTMVERVADRLWLVVDGNCQNFEGDLDAYREHIIEQRRKERSKKRKEKLANDVEKTVDKKELHPKLWQQVERGEKNLQKLQAQLAELETEMAEPAFYNDTANVASAQMKHAQLTKKVATAEAEWLAANDAFEAAA